MIVWTFLFFIIFACFQSICTKNATLEMVNTCYYRSNDHTFVQPNSSTALRLSLLQYGLNCTIEFLSRSPQLQFYFDSLNLPFDSQTGHCLDAVEIYDYDFKNVSRVSACRDDDLPLNRTVVATSPAIIKVVNRCPRGKCNYAQNKYFFWITISEKFIEVPEPTTTNQTIVNTTCEPIINDVITYVTDSMLENVVIILSVFVILMLVMVGVVCWFGRMSLCNRVYRVRSIDSVHLKSKTDVASADEEKGIDNCNGPCIYETDGKKKWTEVAV